MLAALRPDFLDLPIRPSKPRRAGLTHVLDKGCSPTVAEEAATQLGDFIDIWKFGWGTSYVDPCLSAKLEILRGAGILCCTGGTLLEIAWRQRRVDEMFDFCKRLGLDCVEVSDGATYISPADKRGLIGRVRDRGFVVIAEVGSKDPSVQVSPDEWLEEIGEDLAAGADLIVAEGRESGTVGLYDGAGEVRSSLLEALKASDSADRIIYEAPQRAQQVRLLHDLGPNANLGNIAIEDVLGLETLRLGLRADTLALMHPDR